MSAKVFITAGWDRRMLRVNALGRESVLRLDCPHLPTIPHKAKLPLTVKGMLNKSVTLYGYDGSCRLGHPFSVTFTRQKEIIGDCPACGFVGKVSEGSKCGQCGNPVDAIEVITEHHAEFAQRANIRPK